MTDPKITYENKTNLVALTDRPRQVGAEDMNEIKTKFNNIVDVVIGSGDTNYIILPEDFDFNNIPAGYDNSIWEIRYEYDLGGLNVVFPSNVTLKFSGGIIGNYGILTGVSTKIEAGILEIFDASGSFTGTFLSSLVYPEWFGAVGDGITDNTVALQYTIDYADSIGGNKVVLSFGSYKIEGTITLKKNVQIIGSPVNYNALSDDAGATNYATMVRILHSPSVVGTDLFVSDAAQPYGYLSGISLQNLDIFGTANSRYGLDLVRPANCTLKNIIIKRFDENIRINASINMRVEQVDSQYARVVALRIHGDISTSTTFDNCYIHFSPIPMIIEQNTCIGISFTNQTIFESCENGIDIYPGNIIDFTDCYTENIPDDGSAKAVINFGVSGIDEADYAKGSCSIKGGTWNGYNSGADPGSSIFNLDRWANLVVSGLKIGRAGNTILKTAKTKNVVFIGIYEQGITNGLFVPSVQTGIIVLGNNYVGSSFPYLATKQIRFNDRGKWSIDESFTQTDGDLAFAKDGIKPFWLDAGYNIRHNYEGAIGSVEKTDVFGAVAAPDFTGAGSTSLLWAETLDGSVKLITRQSDGKISPVGNFSGTTAQRPTAGNARQVGMQYFDTTLGIPIYYAGSDVWKKYSDNTVA